MPEFVKRFHGKYDVREGGCWEWNRYIYPNGYGYHSISGKNVCAHRASWMIHFGEIPAGMVVCHRCDNKTCVNPEHLFIGSQADNVRDCISKGRHAVGSGNGKSKLKEQQVLEIFLSKERTGSLVKRFGVSRATILSIRTGTRWGHLTNSPRPTP